MSGLKSQARFGFFDGDQSADRTDHKMHYTLSAYSYE